MSNYVPAKVIRSIITPDPSKRKALNKSLQVKPLLTLTTHEYGTNPIYRTNRARTGSAGAPVRGAIPGEGGFARPVNLPYLTPARVSGMAALRATTVAGHLGNASPLPGFRSTPIPPAGLGQGSQSSPAFRGAAAAGGFPIGLAVLALGAFVLLR